ncbi:MAG: lysine exporter LysO family protein [Anaerolineae bacterium]|nr:lysine exporter LysO family protein [Anaerolineae bacterium]MDW8071224.1 lysine exporter LysO family protein [Anaerolineae bacterium]
MKSSLIILVCFAAGVLTGWLVPLPRSRELDDYTLYLLCALLLFVGISVGGDPHFWQSVRQRDNLHMALLPLLVVLGTLFGVAVVSLLLPALPLRDALAVGAGFGYYSLSSVLLTQMRGETLGVIALLANLMREVATLVLAPLLVRFFGKLAPIASGGATAMDSTLPIIVRFSGKEYSIVALFSGIVLTAAVPFLILIILAV